MAKRDDQSFRINNKIRSILPDTQEVTDSSSVEPTTSQQFGRSRLTLQGALNPCSRPNPAPFWQVFGTCHLPVDNDTQQFKAMTLGQTSKPGFGSFLEAPNSYNFDF